MSAEEAKEYGLIDGVITNRKQNEGTARFCHCPLCEYYTRAHTYMPDDLPFFKKQEFAGGSFDCGYKNKWNNGVKKWLEDWMTESAVLFAERQTDRYAN